MRRCDRETRAGKASREKWKLKNFLSLPRLCDVLEKYSTWKNHRLIPQNCENRNENFEFPFKLFYLLHSLLVAVFSVAFMASRLLIFDIIVVSSERRSKISGHQVAHFTAECSWISVKIRDIEIKVLKVRKNEAKIIIKNLMDTRGEIQYLIISLLLL